ADAKPVAGERGGVQSRRFYRAFLGRSAPHRVGERSASVAYRNPDRASRGRLSALMTGRLYRVGVDIGGTFTDLVLVGDDGTLATRKVLSTPPDYADGIVAGVASVLAEAGGAAGAVGGGVHGTA